jgi:DNA-binding XRE family transcriptional regulator|nr:MAG TPA: protein of unknown function (DUF4447) [Caudoviricetes sp.]
MTAPHTRRERTPDDDPRRPRAVHLRAARELLGVAPEAMAELLGVTDRTYRAWESGRDPVPVGVADEVGGRVAQTLALADGIAALLREAADADPDGPPAVVAHTSDAEYRRAHPGAALTARWWRLVCLLAAARVPGARVIGPGDTARYRVVPAAPPAGARTRP